MYFYMDWLPTAFYWYFATFVLGLIFFPLTKTLFPNFIDRGYAFSRTVAILVLSYLIYVAGSLKLLAFEQSNLILFAFIFLIFFLVFLKKTRQDLTQENLKIILFEEVLFLVSFIFLVVVRGREPSIRGLEKFMDFGIINSILNSRYFPPLDIWLSADPASPKGYPINYYYFGHLTAAFLIKLTGVKPAVGYNLFLATLLGLGATGAFSITSNLVYFYKKSVLKLKKIAQLPLIFYGILGSFIVNLGGNLHTIYLFTKGYPNEQPIPFWQIFSGFNPNSYWYPNATRFIPYTIHEFPSYSWVVADLHGHVFDIPFVLLTLALLAGLFIRLSKTKIRLSTLLSTSVLIGFLVAVHYMTNAFDGPIYFLLFLALFLILFGLTKPFFVSILTSVVSFLLFSLPFTSHFKAFVTGIGVNCSSIITGQNLKVGPFLLDPENCQISPFWMIFVLWGFFFVSFLLLILVRRIEWRAKRESPNPVDVLVLVSFIFGLFLIFIPEFFYVKDIYPAHFRANTMFKLGYQAFILMGVASAYSFYRISLLKKRSRYGLKLIFLILFFFVFLYPFFSFPSFYGKCRRAIDQEKKKWLQREYPADFEIVNYINDSIKGQPVILEAQGDSYTDYERISAYTGKPTVAGWWVHEWLWRGSAEVVGRRIPDINAVFESQDLAVTRDLLKRYKVSYVVISYLEKEKYKNLNEDKFGVLGRKIFESSDKGGALYQLK